MAEKRPYTRAQIVKRLRDEIANGRPLIGAGSSCGLVARAAEAGGADLIIIYNTGTSRQMGLPTTHTINHANPSTMAMYPEIANVVEHTPLIGGAQAQDPTYYDLGRLVDAYRATGFDGLINFPTLGPMETDVPSYADRIKIGLALNRDFEMVRIARQRDFFTICYAYNEEQAIGTAAAGCDAIVAHAGWTTGGLVGAGEYAMSMERARDHVQKLIDLARRENPEVIALAHGGPIEGPKECQYLYDTTESTGFLGASSVERIPVETALINAIKGFKAQRPRVL